MFAAPKSHIRDISRAWRLRMRLWDDRAWNIGMTWPVNSRHYPVLPSNHPQHKFDFRSCVCFVPTKRLGTHELSRKCRDSCFYPNPCDMEDFVHLIAHDTTVSCSVAAPKTLFCILQIFDPSKSSISQPTCPKHAADSKTAIAIVPHARLGVMSVRKLHPSSWTGPSFQTGISCPMRAR